MGKGVEVEKRPRNEISVSRKLTYMKAAWAHRTSGCALVKHARMPI